MDQALEAKAGELLELVSGIASRYRLASLDRLIQVCESAAARQDLSIALLGRFKAGKSSFLNHLIGRNLLPVGVVPVTSVITEMRWDREERAEVRFTDGRRQLVPLGRIAEFVTEAENPQNVKQVATVSLYLPDLERYKGLHLVDTPGLESAFAHNTETSLAWVPNVDVAVVAVGVDPPLAQQDVALIRKLFEYTPKVCVLLTKVDVLTEPEMCEVLKFVRRQLNQSFEERIEVFPYSIREGFASLQFSLEEQLFAPTLKAIQQQKREILARKLQRLLQECGDYLQLALRSAEMTDREGQQLRERAVREKKAFSDIKLEMQLIGRHNIAGSRYHIEQTLAPYEKPIVLDLSNLLEQEYPTWKFSFARMLEHFQSWLFGALRSRLTGISASCEPEFRKPLCDVQRQNMRVLQAFRDRLSEQTMELFGVPLRTTETEIEPKSPSVPDIKIGRIFGYNWELLSPILPMAVLRTSVKTRLLHKVEYETSKSLSRLTTQWADTVTSAITDMQREAERRLEELIRTVEHLTESSIAQAPDIRSDLDRVRQAQADLQA